MKRTALILAIALGTTCAAPVLAGENLFAPPKPMPDNFTAYFERTVEEQQFNKSIDGGNKDRSMFLEPPATGANHAEIHQRGTNHNARLRQTGTNNSFKILQMGNGAVADVEQSGNGKIGFLFQFAR